MPAAPFDVSDVDSDSADLDDVMILGSKMDDQKYANEVKRLTDKYDNEKQFVLRQSDLMKNRLQFATDDSRRMAREFSVRFLDFLSGRPVGTYDRDSMSEPVFEHKISDANGFSSRMEFTIESEKDMSKRMTFDKMLRLSIRANIPSDVITGVTHGNIAGLVARIRAKYNKFDRIQLAAKVLKAMNEIELKQDESFDMFVTRFQSLTTRAVELDYRVDSLTRFILFQKAVLGSKNKKAIELYNRKATTLKIETVAEFIAAVGPEMVKWEEQEKRNPSTGREVKTALNTHITPRSGKSPCIWFNQKGGCKNPKCRFDHVKVDAAALAKLVKHREKVRKELQNRADTSSTTN